MLRILLLCLISVCFVGCSYTAVPAECENATEETESVMEPQALKNKTCSQKDFDNIIVGESTIKDVDAISDIHILDVRAYGYYTEFPIGDGNAMCFVFCGPDYVVAEMYVGEEDSTFSEVYDFSQLEELQDSRLKEYLNNSVDA